MVETSHRTRGGQDMGMEWIAADNQQLTFIRDHLQNQFPRRTMGPYKKLERKVK